jgi:nucleotidyltransferase/DNA polymerase involved in DNA repair
VFKVLNAYDENIIVERASIDEAYLDLTALVNCYSLSSDFDNPTILPNIDDLPATHVATGNDRPSDANFTYPYAYSF